MAEEKKNQTVFQGVADAINFRKKTVPAMPTASYTTPPTSSSGGLIPKDVNQIENMQQQYLDWQVNKVSHNLYTRQLYFDSDRISAYQDYRAMDQSPEIAAALDIIRDECLEANTIIPLLNGEKVTIEELYNSGRENFYVYSYNAHQGIFEPGLCERVAYKGEQDVYKITFDDESFVMATSEHLWLSKSSEKYKKTQELVEGDSIEPFYTRISDGNDRIKGYEMILEGGEWNFTHRMVKKHVWPNEKGVVHHKDFSKLNNDPSNLEVMSWKEHQDLHTKLNSARWESEEYATKMRKTFSETNSIDGPYWSNKEWRDRRVGNMKKERAFFVKGLTKEQKKDIFSRPNEKNGMFDKGWKLEGEKNGRFLIDKRREFSKEELLEAFKNTSSIEQACDKLNTTRRILYKSKVYKELNIERWEDLGFTVQKIDLESIKKSCEKYLGYEILEQSMSKICRENGWTPKKVNTFLYKEGYGKWTDFVAQYDSKNKIFDSIKEYVKQNGNTSFAKVCKNLGLSEKKTSALLERSKYKNYSTLKSSINHKVKSVEFIGKRKTYDLVNVGQHHNFAVLTSNGTGVVSHNCLTRNDRGNILEVYSENHRVKDALNDLFKNRLNIDFNLKPWIRDLVKYGDYFVYLHIDKTEGIYNYMALPVDEVHREDGYDNTPEKVRFRWETTNDYFEDWQIAHFRLLEDSRRYPYGRSVLDPARKLWKQLQLAEDSMLVYRITRAPERRVFYIEVGNVPEADLQQYMMKVQNQIKKQPVVNQANGSYNFKYDPMNITEDYFIPMRGDKTSRIDTLPGACLALDTKIELLDGRSVALSEIIAEHESGKELWSYSINPESGEIVPGQITWAGVTRKNTQVVKITLDNGETITCTPDHKFPTKFNGLKEAQDLVPGESLWSFNKKFEKIKGAGKKRRRNTYEMIFDHQSKKWVYTHRMVGNYFKNLDEQENFVYLESKRDDEKKTIHHKNFNRYDNTPSNLCFMNSSDHFYYHQDNMKNLEAFFGTEKIEEWKDARRDGIVKYWENISEYELEGKKKIAKTNFKKGSDRLQELLKDKDYKKAFYEKTSKTLKEVRGTEKAKQRQSEIATLQWSDADFRKNVVEKQTIKYSDTMIQYVVGLFKSGLSAAEIVANINSVDSTFMSEFLSLNQGNKQLKKMQQGFTHNNLVKMMKHFGYSNWRDFKNKVEYFNHQIVSVEFLDELQDTGTITIDGPEKYHNYHNFALSVGVFTKNSNLGDIQDIEYLQNKLFAALKVPKTYLNYGEALPGGSTLSQADLRFSRTINNIQDFVLLELRRIANIHLWFSGFQDDMDNFSLSLTNPSTQQELLKLETQKARLEVFNLFFNNEASSPASWTWSMENILGFSKEEIKLILKQKKVEKKIFQEIDSAVDTYKKIGLFSELDAKYEIPGAAQQLASGGEGAGEEGPGGGAGGGGGSSMLGGMGNLEVNTDINAPTGQGFGGGDTAPSGGGGEPEALEEPLAERIRRADRVSNVLTESMIEDLLGMELAKEEPPKMMISDNVLIKKNASLNNITQNLIDSIETSMKNRPLVQETKYVQRANTTSIGLFDKNKELSDKVEGMFNNMSETFEIEIPETETGDEVHGA